MHIPRALRAKPPLVGRRGEVYSAEVMAGLEAIGQSVREARRRAGLRQRDLERRCGLDQSVISRIENGRMPSLRWTRFAALIGALGNAWDPPRERRDPRDR